MYKYEEQKRNIFTEEGSEMFMKIRDNVKRLLKESGAVRMAEAMKCVSGDSWLMLACVDRLVELGEIKEIPQSNPAGQHRIFISASN